MAKILIKTPVTYYGGKQKMLQKILPLIPEHAKYVEPFLGGGAVFWAKTPAKFEVINDLNEEITNFMQVLRDRFEELKMLITQTFHSRSMYEKSLLIYRNSHLFSSIERAWAFWMQTNMTFLSIIENSFTIDHSNRPTRPKSIHFKKERFTIELSERLRHVSIERIDAVDLINRHDNQEAFFYVDPPYFNANMGHYDFYTKEDYIKLLDALTEVKGKFLLSSYNSGLIENYVKENGWTIDKIEMTLDAGSLKKKRKKTEVLVRNY